jgi:hypothetical protein
MNTMRSALSTIATVDGTPAGQHELVRRFMKAVFQENPTLPRYEVTWDPQVVLNYIKSLGPNRKLSLLQLSRKVTMLLLLLSGQRGQTMHLFDIRNMTLTKSKLTVRIGDLLKTSRPKHHVSEVTFKAYAPDRRLCIVTAVKCYLEQTELIRGDITQLLITTKKPIKGVSCDTIRRWTKDIMKSAGLDMTMFSAHSTRAAATSAAAKRLPLATVLKTVGWSNESTFAKYYQKPIVNSTCLTDAILQ